MPPASDRPAPVPLPVVRRLESVATQPALSAIPAQPRRLDRPVVVPLRSTADPDAGSLRRQLADLKQELARLRG